jgi:hypothetical protein
MILLARRLRYPRVARRCGTSVPFNPDLSAEWAPPTAEYDVADPRVAMAVPHFDTIGIFVFSTEPSARAFEEPRASPRHEFVPLSLAPARDLPARPDLPSPHEDDDCEDRDSGNEERVW